MARFYGEIEGQGTREITKTGSKKSGIYAHVRGWDVGVKIYGKVNSNDEDVLDIYLSRGSNAMGRDKYLASVKVIDGEFIIK